MKTLCYVATIPAVVHAFLRPHIQAAAEKYRVTVICNEADKHLLEGLKAQLILLPIERKPSFVKDVTLLIKLIFLFKKQRFDIVHSIMPKTGLIAMLAAKLTQIPTRIHTFTGQVWATKIGLKRVLLRSVDKLIGWLATSVLTDSPSQRDFLINEGVLSSLKVKVIGAGSICGVDPLRFHADMPSRQFIRHNLEIPAEAKVILFVGRLNRDKGMLDLAAAFNALARQHSELILLLVGAEEEITFSQIQQLCQSVQTRLRYVSFTATPEYYMAAADIFCLPSYREGFGLTIIEAAACGVPAVASNIYGITDAVEDGMTGLLFPAGDIRGLTRALTKLIIDNELRINMGQSACARALDQFSCAKITSEMVGLYDNLS
ncbi:MAG: glycosyltransferase family 4 protein [Gallionellaceae bacterium]|jgi:glycosyltransferase involved in cell wall biosynthesis